MQRLLNLPYIEHSNYYTFDPISYELLITTKMLDFVFENNIKPLLACQTLHYSSNLMVIYMLYIYPAITSRK